MEKTTCEKCAHPAHDPEKCEVITVYDDGVREDKFCQCQQIKLLKQSVGGDVSKINISDDEFCKLVDIAGTFTQQLRSGIDDLIRKDESGKWIESIRRHEKKCPSFGGECLKEIANERLSMKTARNLTKKLEEYTQLVPLRFRGPWILDWDLKCPCHLVAFNCASEFCKV